MKIDTNDPRITAFALGELTGSEATEMARAVRSDSNIRKAVEEVRETASLLHGTIGGGEVHLLTSEQREAVRSAGGGATITEISSAHVPLWKRPAVVGIGAAAAVALGVFITQQQGGDTPQTADTEPAWDWSQVDMENLTSPVVVDGTNEVALSNPKEASATAVAAAISEDTASFREELQKRISEQTAESLPKLPDLVEQDWTLLDGNNKVTVPLASGATSWPLVQRYLSEMSTLPPSSAVRIEEMVNHFGYKTPTMLKGGGLVADMEICNTPWNPATMLLAVHISSDSDITVDSTATLTFNGAQVKRARILGYSGLSSNNSQVRPRHISKSHGNYVIYELELNTHGAADSEQPVATLQLGSQQAQSLVMKSGQASSWLNASADLRFASTVTATGMLLASTSSAGELDAARLLSLLDVLEKKDTTSILGERKRALPLLKRAAQLYKKSSDIGN